MNNMKILIVFIFESPYWKELAVIEGEPKDLLTIEDSFSSYLDSAVSDDKEYVDMVADVLNASGLKWKKVIAKIPECDRIHTIWI